MKDCHIEGELVGRLRPDPIVDTMEAIKTIENFIKNNFTDYARFCCVIKKVNDADQVVAFFDHWEPKECNWLDARYTAAGCLCEISFQNK